MTSFKRVGPASRLMRVTVIVAAFAVLFVAASPSHVGADATPSSEFGAPGAATFSVHEGPDGLTAAEPTIGVNWNTDAVFYHSQELDLSFPNIIATELSVRTFRVDFADGSSQWTDVSPPYQAPITLDPMLHVDPDTGRIFAGGLHGTCSIMMFSDDDGGVWGTTGNMCSGPDFDHQSIGSGPTGLPLPGDGGRHVAYYCGQGGTISCAMSPDGGITWGPFITENTPCQGFHGHIRVSRVTATMAVPVADCGGDLGMLVTQDGLTYEARTIPDSEAWTNGFDPSLQFGRGEGWLWYGMASEHGIHISVSKDDGLTWEPIGTSMGVAATPHLEIGQFHDPPILSGTFADVQVGDDDRVAFTFMGIEDYPGADRDFLQSNNIFQCEDRQDEIIWHYYAAFTYDAGDTWSVTRISEDPVQIGGMYDVMVEGSGACRNLLDFNDMDIDSKGRVYVGFADGCIDECAASSEPDTEGYRANAARMYRQETGRGLFAAYDVETAAGPADDPSAGDDSEDTPGFGLLAAVVALAGAVAATARRRS